MSKAVPAAGAENAVAGTANNSRTPQRARVSEPRRRERGGIRAGFDMLVRAIIRPPRMQYTVKDLGDTRLRMGSVVFFREDFKVVNARGLSLVCSLWTPLSLQKQTVHRRSVILYLHPNSSCRLDCVRTKLLALASHTHTCVCGFDFSGSGQSDGDYISLGWYEKEDTRIVFEELLYRGFKKIVLWGRSMGAATALMFAGEYGGAIDDVCVGLILDSPFSSFEALAIRIAQSGAIRVPSFAASPAIGLIRWSVRSRANFDILKVCPIKASEHIRIPAVVLTAEGDEIVHPVLSTNIYETLKGPKVHIVFQGTHNSRRPAEVFAALKVFIEGSLCNKPPAAGGSLMESVRNTACTPLPVTPVADARSKDAQAKQSEAERRGGRSRVNGAKTDQDTKEQEEANSTARDIAIGNVDASHLTDADVHEIELSVEVKQQNGNEDHDTMKPRASSAEKDPDETARVRSLPAKPEIVQVHKSPKLSSGNAPQRPVVIQATNADEPLLEPQRTRRRWPRLHWRRKSQRGQSARDRETGMMDVTAVRVTSTLADAYFEQLIDEAVQELVREGFKPEPRRFPRLSLDGQRCQSTHAPAPASVWSQLLPFIFQEMKNTE